MKIASLSELKRELKESSQESLVELCLKLSKYKKENKELLHYLVFEEQDEASFIAAVKEEIEMELETTNTLNFYWAKKTIRKVLRIMNKYIKFSKKKQTELELRIFYCQQLLSLDLDLQNSLVLSNLYHRQIALIDKALTMLHPDLQYDYEADIEALRW